MNTGFSQLGNLLADVNWQDQGNKAVGLLQEYIRINTCNPPGNEEAGAKFLKTIFDREGIDNEIIFSAPGRANFRAVLPGKGTAKPLLLLNHIDVVEAAERNWEVPPFSGKIKDGYIWGRGALDMKSTSIAQLMSVLILKRINFIPDRDIIFLAVADEEMGGKFGMEYLMKNHFDKIDAEYVLNEGGSGIIKEDARGFMIENSQKRRLLIKLNSSGKLSHSSQQKTKSATQQLIKALDKIYYWKTRIRFTPSATIFFKKLAKTQTFPASLLLKHITNPFFKYLVLSKLKKDEYFSLLIRDSISVTKLEAGNGLLVTPDKASACLDCRLLPGRKTEEFIDDLKQLIGDDSVNIEILAGSDEFENLDSSVKTPLFDVICSVINNNLPDFIITPVLIPGTTDSRFFRSKGITSYGFQPFKISAEDMRGYHSDNERISIQNIHLGVKMMTEVISLFTHSSRT